MIRIASPSMQDELKSIWSECFGDPPAYIDFVFDRIIKPADTLVHIGGDGTVDAMLCMRSASLCAPGVPDVKCAYIFGVATALRAQGKGFSTALLEEAHLTLSGDGFAASALVPAGERLFEFYGKRGYENCFSLKKAGVSAADMPKAPLNCVLTPWSLERMEEYRDAAFGDCLPYLKWGAEHLKAISAEARLSGGLVLRYACAGESGYAVCYRYGNAVKISEVTHVGGPVLESVLAAVHSRFRAARYIVYLRADADENFSAHVLPFGMLRWYDKKTREQMLAAGGGPGYISHVLD